MSEAAYQRKLIKKLENLFPGCVLLKNDSGYMQGIPDWTILWRRNWAALEIKNSISARKQPNQPYYIEQLDRMSFAAFICPENEDEVLSALQQAFASRGAALVSKP